MVGTIDFLPSKRCNSFICFIAAASSEAGTTSSPAATAVRLPSRYFFPLKQQAGLNTMQTRHMGHRHTGFHCLLNNGDFFLRSFTFTKLLPQQNSSHLKIRTSVRHISRPISYFKIHPLPGVSRGRFTIDVYITGEILFNNFG
ncbi:hypothetical protein BvCmsKSP011_00307 [Escherichia coli]|nr:hypothetical protein EC12741_B0214 [Escherichia coli 1.2741]GDJ66300.1 hypothetical protein BvCmsKSP011_00307 [Escherichia coli]GDN88943.1 hypothetical protein BvCmsNSNP027_02648 [Escherichia coli]